MEHIMSENHRPFSLDAAKKYNSKQDYILFDEITDAIPDLALRNDGEKFALAVHKYQQDNGLLADGCLGRQTYTHLLSTYFPSSSEYVVYNSARIPLPKRDEYRLVTFDEPNGLDLHRFGNFSTRSDRPTSVCVHWGGLDAQHCYNVFASRTRKVSSHFLIGLEDGQAVVYQVLDAQHKAWHGGTVNDVSIGIDICQQATTSWKDHYDKEGYGLSVIDNPTGRGEKKVLSLHPKLKVAAAVFISDLFDALNLDLLPAPDASSICLNEVQDGTVTLFGHSHVNRRKWDIAPYWDEIIDEIFLEEEQSPQS
jgi:hypothetical protein